MAQLSQGRFLLQLTFSLIITVINYNKHLSKLFALRYLSLNLHKIHEDIA